jgi:hypothetical protein
MRTAARLVYGTRRAESQAAMKIGIRTASLNQQVPEAFATAGRLGYDGVEIVTRDEAQLRGWLREDGPGGAAELRAPAAGSAATSPTPWGAWRRGR